MTAAASARPGLSLAQLSEITRRFTDRVLAEEYVAGADPARRWHVRLHADEDVDVWLISWTTEQGTDLHDHGGSAGAFTVVSGTLTESVWGPGGTSDLTREAGETVAFGTRYVHDVRNLDERTAVSVHAYSPPLRLMHFYDVVPGIVSNRLVERVESWTDDPEAPAPDRRAS